MLILGRDPIQGLECTLTAEIRNSINFTEKNKKFCCLHYNWANSYLFVNGREIHQFKAKDWSSSIMLRKHF